MKLLFLLLLLIGCAVNDCAVLPNVTVAEKKLEKTTNLNSNSKKVSERVEGLQDTLQPGAQLKCRFF